MQVLSTSLSHVLPVTTPVWNFTLWDSCQHLLGSFVATEVLQNTRYSFLNSNPRRRDACLESLLGFTTKPFLHVTIKPSQNCPT